MFVPFNHDPDVVLPAPVFADARWAELMAEIAAKLDAPVDEGDGWAALSRAADLKLLARKIDSAYLCDVGRVVRSDIAAVDGKLSDSAFLRHRLNLDQGSARRDVTAAQELADLPAVRAAFAEGRISRRAVDRIISVGTKTRERRAALPVFEGAFADIAEKLCFAVLDRALEAWADQIDPVPGSDDEATAHARRFLRMSQAADGWIIDGFLTKEQGAIVIAALNAAKEKTWREDHARDHLTMDILGGGAEHDPAETVPRTGGQQLADALIDVCRLAVSSDGLPSNGGIRPAVTVTVPLARLAEDPRTPVVPDADVTGQEFPFTDGSAWLTIPNGPGTRRTTAVTAQRLSCDANVRRLVLDPKSLPLDIGRTTRVIPAHLRAAVIGRDRHCIYPGCTVPAAWCDAHHAQHWARGGPTALANLALLCDKHHHAVHQDDLPIRFTTARPTVVIPPRRTKITRFRL